MRLAVVQRHESTWVQGVRRRESPWKIAAQFPIVRVVALSIHSSGEMRCETRSAGAVTFLTKSADAKEVCAAMHTAAAGRS